MVIAFFFCLLSFFLLLSGSVSLASLFLRMLVAWFLCVLENGRSIPNPPFPPLGKNSLRTELYFFCFVFFL